MAVCLGFGWWQNQAARTGGPISIAKMLWLGTAIGCFYVIPWVWWRDTALSAGFRRVAFVFLAGFAVRAVIEMPLLVWTTAWRCWHGLVHDALMLGWLAAGAGFLAPAAIETERSARRGLPLVGAAVVCEMVNAWLFQNVARPQDGVYFASEDSRFAVINRVTWTELALLWPALGFWILRYAWSPRIKNPPPAEAPSFL